MNLTDRIIGAGLTQEDQKKIMPVARAMVIYGMAPNMKTAVDILIDIVRLSKAAKAGKEKDNG